jgi:acyl-coenzyme A thioesterase PaaI-like protein
MDPIEEIDDIDPKRLAAWSKLHCAAAELLDGIAGLRFQSRAVPGLIAAIAAMSDRIEEPEANSAALLRSLRRLPSRGHISIPPIEITRAAEDEVEGTILFGRRYVGGNMAAHGGAVAMMFDELLGGLANRPGQPRSRTAFLTTNYRHVTPIGRRLVVRARIVGREGRKIRACSELFDGETICADAEGLFVVLRPGQP